MRFKVSASSGCLKFFPAITISSIFLTILVLQVGLGGNHLNAQKASESEKRNALYEKVLKDLEVVTTKKTKINFKSVGEKVLILNFWASWCPPCRAEHPKLLELADQGYRVAGVNFRDQQDQAAAYLNDHHDPFFATGFDLRGRVAIDWGVTAPPETFIIDGDGTVLFRFVGPLVGSDYEQRFLPALLDAVK